VQHGAIFGAVNLLTGEHGFDGARQIGLFRQRLEFVEGLLGDAVFSENHQQLIIKGGKEFRKTIGILRKQVGNLYRFHLIKMLLQRFPGCGLCRIDIFHGNTLVDIRTVIPSGRILSGPAC